MRLLPSSQEAELVNFIYLGGLEWGLGTPVRGKGCGKEEEGILPATTSGF